MSLQLHDRRLVGWSLIKPTLGHCDWLRASIDLDLQCVAVVLMTGWRNELAMAIPKCEADTQSALISDLFDIFVLIVHNARFDGCFDTDVSFRIFIAPFTRC